MRQESSAWRLHIIVKRLGTDLILIALNKYFIDALFFLPRGENLQRVIETHKRKEDLQHDERPMPPIAWNNSNAHSDKNQEKGVAVKI